MQAGIFAKTFSGSDPATVLQAARDAGYDCVQYNWACAGLASMPEDISESAIDQTRKALQSAGLSAVALSGTYNMTHPDLHVRDDGLRRLGRVIRSAALLEIPMVTLCSGSRNADDQWAAHPDNDSADAWRDMMKSMQDAMALAEASNVVLGVEPELANTINSVGKALSLMKHFDSPYLKIVLDPANLFERECEETRRNIIADAIEQLAPYISLCHAKDRAADGSFCVAGDGVIDFEHYINCLHGIGFDGPLVTHGLEANDAPRVARFLSALLARKPVK